MKYFQIEVDLHKSDFDLKIGSLGPTLVWVLVEIWCDESLILRFLGLIFCLAALIRQRWDWAPNCGECSEFLDVMGEATVWSLPKKVVSLMKWSNEHDHDNNHSLLTVTDRTCIATVYSIVCCTFCTYIFLPGYRTFTTRGGRDTSQVFHPYYCYLGNH